MRDYDQLTNVQKRMVDDVRTKLGNRLQQHEFDVGYNPVLGNGLVLHSKLRSITQVLNGTMHSVEGVELFLNAYHYGHHQATREVTLANEAAMRKLMGIRIRPDGTLYVKVDNGMSVDED